ncbi:uncharacterized protein LOC130248769 [Oenanthe melanoleuca]|uniref:uncharacterized protein LOC130248769 n=1 Tax=Oenanthe melanoleuca TaxID=2939378 RepID=UPI0024C1B2AF|nr:uncharacterized protein LOC130248769 [Oenanthe melanoleuca]
MHQELSLHAAVLLGVKHSCERVQKCSLAGLRDKLQETVGKVHRECKAVPGLSQILSPPPTGPWQSSSFWFPANSFLPGGLLHHALGLWPCCPAGAGLGAITTAQGLWEQQGLGRESSSKGVTVLLTSSLGCYVGCRKTCLATAPGLERVNVSESVQICLHSRGRMEAKFSPSAEPLDISPTPFQQEELNKLASSRVSQAGA